MKYGRSTLSSGIVSNYYIDVKHAMTNPAVLRSIVSEMSIHISAKKIAGMELGAVPILGALSAMLDMPYLVIRKSPKEHGAEGQIIGAIQRGERIDFIEDVVTSGQTVLKGIDMLRRQGAEVTRAICVVDREDKGKEVLRREGVQLFGLVKASDLLSMIRQS